MKGLSFQAKSNSSDEIPLNESFESTGTSDQLVEIGNDSGSNVEPVTTLWSLTGIQSHRRPSFASTETLKVRNSARLMPLPPATSLYSASLSAMLESPNDFSDEPEPRAIVMPRPSKNESQYSSDECKSEFFDNMIAMKSDLNRRWKIEPSSAQEERNIVATDTVWVEEAKFVSYDNESPEDSVDKTRAHAITILNRADEQDASRKCNEIVWKAWGCNDLTTRRHIMCFMFLLFLVVLVVAVLIGIHSADEPAQRASAANRPQSPDDDAWIGDLPDNKPTEETPKPKPPQTNVPRPAPPQSPMSPTKSPNQPTTGAESPGSPTRQPALSTPESSVSPSKWPSTSTPSPTIAPIVPTVKPNLTTETPTNAQRESTSSPSEQPSICQSSIRVAKSCYAEEDKIVINFVNCSPREGDWIGIWRTREDPANLSEDFLGWAWTCGTQSCQRSPVSKRIAIDAYGLGFDSFTAFLVHDKAEGAPYAAEVMSEPFIVTNFCCD